MKKLLFATALCMFLISGCAPAGFYSDSDLSKNTGLRYFTPKPYLQVEKDANTSSINKISVIYLPDIENPQYLSLKKSIGSSKTDIKLENGSVVSFSLDSDPATDKILEALAALVSKGAAAAENVSKLSGIPGGSQSSVVELYEVLMNAGETTLRRIDIR